MACVTDDIGQNVLYARRASALSTTAERVSLVRTIQGTGIRSVAAWAGPRLRLYDPPHTTHHERPRE